MELCLECRRDAGYRATLLIYEGILTVGQRHQLIEQHTRTLQLKDHALSERDLIVQKLTTTLDMTKTENHSLKEALETAKNHAQDAEKQLAHVEGQLEVYRTVQPPHQD